MNRLVSAVFLVFFSFLGVLAYSQPNFGGNSLSDSPQENTLLENEALVAENPYVINGTVSGPGGGAENITVFLELRYTSQRYPSVFLQAQTDAQGFFQFDLSPYNAPEYALEFYTSSYRFQMGRHFKKLRRLELPYSFNLSLPLGVVVRGSVEDEEGNPLADVVVSGTNLITVKSSKAGTFEMTGLSPNYHELNFFKEGYAEVLHVVQKPEPGVLSDVRIVLAAAGKLKGTVTDWLGRPVASAQVVYQEPNAFKETRTSNEGTYEFTGVSRAKPAELIVTSFAAPKKQLELPLELPLDEETVDVSLDPPAYLAGKIVLEDQLPAASALIYAYDPETNAFLGQAEANSEGEFRVGPFALGQEVMYEVRPPQLKKDLAIADMNIEQNTATKVVSGDIVRFENSFQSTFEIEMDEQTLRMTRLDSGNGGFPGKVIYNGTRATDGSGGFSGELEIPALGQKGTFELLPRGLMQDGVSGSWVLREKFTAEQKCFSPLTGTAMLPKFPGEKYVTKALLPGETISGRAFDESGLPIQEGVVMLYNWNKNPNYREMAEIKLDGFFQFTCVPEGDFEIEARSKDGSTETNASYTRSGARDVVLTAEPEADDSVVEFTLPQ